ncbi:MAG: cytochrome c oxidase subunit 3 [Flavobacteriales bacterium]|nr:cytochrome c oxidase subunit 3 [Flavobacteriales bacterium]MCX7769065.1 cytochrome c oxidase subunit 3 [Flavobacteriales bacterium]MDW8410746.1 cytochrome c oxidase subunit 3 [Flavobacteriales bacterium]
MAQAATLETKKNLWGGGVAPFNVSYGKLMMWIFLLSDTFTFSSLLISYGFMRFKYDDAWPLADNVFVHFPFYPGHIKLAFVSLMTFTLIMSSVTMVLAVEAGHRFDKKGVIKWLLWTIFGGLFFLASQTYEWYHFITGTEHGKAIPMFVDGQWKEVVVRGANLRYNEYGHQLFANFFFFITGFHGSHVFSGVVLNVIGLIMTIRGYFERQGHYEFIEKIGLYWHFVDLVWVFVFTFFYLI